jgi:hypothetical protein
MDQEQEDRRPTDSDVPYKKQRPNTPPLQNPNGVDEQAIEQQQQAGRKRKRRTKKASKKSKKSRRKSRRTRR